MGTLTKEHSATAPSAVIAVEAEVLRPGTIVETCRGCGQAFDIKVKRSSVDRDYCVSCAAAARHDINTAKRDNSHWLERALELGIPPWEQQPGEGNEEYELWEYYRALWPEVRPTVTRVANDTGVSTGKVQRVATMWTWPARLQSWVREVNADRTAELRAAKRRMVEDHITLGERMRAKMVKAVDALDPEDLTPNELVALLKETQRLEQTSRDALDAVERDTAMDIDNMPRSVTGQQDDQVHENSKGLSVDDMAEVVGILQQAGVLQVNGARVGVRQTTTTEVVAATDEL